MPDSPPPPTGEPADLPPPVSRDPRPWPPPGGASEPVPSGTDTKIDTGPPDVVYEGDFGKPAAEGALASLLCGIVGIAFCGIFTGIPAVVLAKQARASIAEDPTQYSGGGMAIVGMVLGWIAILRDVVLFVVTLAVVTSVNLSPLYNNLPFVGG